MSDRIIISVEADDVDKRIDLFLVETLPEQTDGTIFSRSTVQKLISDGMVETGGKTLTKNYRLRPLDLIAVTIPDPIELQVSAVDIPLNIVFEDSDVIVVNKPKGMVVHPAPGHYSDTLVNALLFHCSDSLSGINGVMRPGIVPRIDKDTSGLLVVAKNDRAHISLAEQLAVHSMQREYMAVVHGRLKESTGVIDMPIGRSEKDRKKFDVLVKNAKSAVTHYTVIEEFESYSLLSLRLETGRTHQIRVHMSAIGHPVAGDTVYGPKNTPKELCGQCLHAKQLGFIHPTSGEKLLFDSELPDYFTDFLHKISTKVI